MEEVIAQVIEKSLIGGAFLFMLYHNNVTFAGTLKEVSQTLGTISSTMNRMDMRMEQVEKDVEVLKRKGGD